VGLAYVVASYFAQGAFKETIEALLVLAFVLALREATRPQWSELPLRFAPAGLIAVGAVYAYSFPGLIWMVGAFVIWAVASFALERRWPQPRAVGLGLLVFGVLIAPEIGRMIDFHRFETFDPNGPGLGNLFGQVSPFEALGIWPSGDFRLAAGDGAVPAIGYYLGVAFALVLLVYGIFQCGRRRETAVLSGLAAAAIAYLAARTGGTAYTAAKAIEIAAPLVTLTILLPLAEAGNAVLLGMREEVRSQREGGRRLVALAGVVFVLAAGICSALAFANAPVGPTSYSPALTGLRPLVAEDSTLVIAAPTLLADEHGGPYISWELRGGRVCIAEGELDEVTKGVRYVVTRGAKDEPPFPDLKVRKVAPPYVLWEVTGSIAAQSPCPLIAVRQARQGEAR
jgi:hypothetical protein